MISNDLGQGMDYVYNVWSSEQLHPSQLLRLPMCLDAQQQKGNTAQACTPRTIVGTKKVSILFALRYQLRHAHLEQENTKSLPGAAIC